VIRQLLFEKLPGYTGVDVADRGGDPEGDAQLTVEEMERLVASWIVGIWQDRVLHDCPPAWDPAGRTARTRCSPRRSPRPGSPWKSRGRNCSANCCQRTMSASTSAAE
jgi:hypothetical protein